GPLRGHGSERIRLRLSGAFRFAPDSPSWPMSRSLCSGVSIREQAEAERFVVPRKPGNAGGGKGPQFKTDAIRGEGPGDWETYQLHKCSEAADGVARESVTSCPRAGCGKSACPVR